MLTELEILDLIQDFLRWQPLDKIMVVITRLADKGMLWILLALVLLLRPKTRKLGLEMLVAIMIEVFICNILLKPIIARPRPFTLNNGIELLISRPTDYSFPSGHSAVSFAGATTLLIHRSPFKWFALILAVCISFSRLYLYVHYPSDVLAGALFGTISSMIASQLMKKRSQPLQ
ncbi:phosphatase PAP2 family protein [Pygmaiobacter massiliensis]|uniref:phosphatase PAP2 family protein n=1 Tax=Pygmaiobacter massiliensis TaxID=1917873 RepID=UPI00289B54E0|nr:phosphatase PAP2 family protein [Pygmaiobacter massiliensis]